MTGNFSASRQRRPRAVRTLPMLKRTLAQWRSRHARVALVPTMGALHAGHLALVRLARRRADRVIVSIFVNPTQFAPHEDLAAYPRTFDRGSRRARRRSRPISSGRRRWRRCIRQASPPASCRKARRPSGLEDAFRPHFFAGVATVVTKLLIQCEPDIAVFGEKDYQQLKVVTQIARDLGLKTRIVGAPVVREADGLAMSSRNAYLTPRERELAPTLHRVLAGCAQAIAAGKAIDPVLDQGRIAIKQAGFALDYLEARNAETLASVASAHEGPLRLLVAARIGKTRLIDNVGV